MAIFKTKLKELRDADVAYISLVDRAATRIPFRVTKADKEHDMLNLSGLGRIMKGDKAAIKADAPTISGIVVFDNPDKKIMDAVKKALTDNDFDVGTVVKNDDGTLLFAQCDAPMEGAEVVRVSDQMLVVLKGFDKGSETLRENAGFNEIVTPAGFFPGVNTAFDGMYFTMQSALTQKADPVALTEALGKFSNYVMGLASALPEAAFKADAQINELLSAEVETVQKTGNNTILDIEELVKQAPSGSDGTQWSAMSTVDKIKWILASYTQANSSGAQKGDKSGDCGGKAGEPDADDEEMKKKAKKAEEDAAALKALLDAALAPLVTQVQSLAAKTDTQQTAIEEIAKKSDTALKTLKGTIATPANAGDPLANDGTPARKHDDDPRTGCFDTAFIARRQKRDKMFG